MIPLSNSPLKARAFHQLTPDLMSTCLHTEEKDHPASLEKYVVSISSSPTAAGFLDQDYWKKSVATQISHDARLAPKLPPLQGIEPCCIL